MQSIKNIQSNKQNLFILNENNTLYGMLVMHDNHIRLTQYNDVLYYEVKDLYAVLFNTKIYIIATARSLEPLLESKIEYTHIVCFQEFILGFSSMGMYYIDTTKYERGANNGLNPNLIENLVNNEEFRMICMNALHAGENLTVVESRVNNLLIVNNTLYILNVVEIINAWGVVNTLSISKLGDTYGRLQHPILYYPDCSTDLKLLMQYMHVHRISPNIVTFENHEILGSLQYTDINNIWDVQTNDHSNLIIIVKLNDGRYLTYTNSIYPWFALSEYFPLTIKDFSDGSYI